jgi:flagellar biosynthesis protein FliQ
MRQTPIQIQILSLIHCQILSLIHCQTQIQNQTLKMN